MNKIKIRFIGIIYWLAIIVADFFVYFVLGVLQMDYDDNYLISKGEYGSLTNMNKLQLFFFVSLQIWNILNLVGLILIGLKIYKRIKNDK